MRVGVRLPQYGSTWHEIRDAAIRCERLGFDGLWVNDHFQSPGRRKSDATFEALTTLAAVAQHTDRARLGVAVLSASYRSAAVIAKSMATIDAMAPGRCVVGLGTGSDRAEHTAFDVPFLTPAGRTEQLRASLASITGQFAGAGAPNNPPARPPVWLAAHRRRLLELAGSSADGVVAAFVDPAAFARRRDIAESARTAAGRTELAYCLYTFVLPICAETDRWLVPQAEFLGTTPAALRRWLATTGIVAPLDELRDRLREYGDIGATDALLAVPERVPLEMWDAIAQAVL